jgi:methionyl-tRNA formyltransferase
VNVFLCGQGIACETILRRYLTPDRYDVVLFTHVGSTIFDQARAWQIPATINPINEIDKWPVQPELIISVYYRHIISQDVINRVGGRIFNAHTSLLPRHRGRSPIPWAIVEGDHLTGVTYHYIDSGIDTGPIILQAVCQITDDDTQTSLFDKINRLVVANFPPALSLVLSGWKGVPQEGHSSYHFAGPPHRGQIDPAWPLGKIERFIRAMTYPPLPPAKLGDREIHNMDDYRKALYERHVATKRINSLTV